MIGKPFGIETDQFRDVIFPFAQRRYLQGQYVQLVIQLLQQGVFLRPVGQVRAAAGNYTAT